MTAKRKGPTSVEPASPTSDLRLTERLGAVRFDVLVRPRSSREAIGPLVGGALAIAVKAPPVEGEANAAVVAALARALGVRRADVRIVSGQSGKRKTVEVAGVTRAAVLGLVPG